MNCILIAVYHKRNYLPFINEGTTLITIYYEKLTDLYHSVTVYDSHIEWGIESYGTGGIIIILVFDVG